MGLKIVLNESSKVGVEGEKMRLSSKWLRSPSIASLKMQSSSLSRRPSKGLDLRCCNTLKFVLFQIGENDLILYFCVHEI